MNLQQINRAYALADERTTLLRRRDEVRKGNPTFGYVMVQFSEDVRTEDMGFGWGNPSTTRKHHWNDQFQMEGEAARLLMDRAMTERLALLEAELRSLGITLDEPAEETKT